MEKIEKELCPFCNNKTLTLIEDQIDIPYFGKCYLFSMSCSSCNYNKSDVEAEERKEPTRYTFEVKTKKDLSVRVIKSSEATIKVPELKMSVTPGPASEGYISNVEGVLERFKKIIESERDIAEDDETRIKAKNLLKKLWKVMLGEVSVKIIIEDPSGNSAIISKDAKVEKLKIK
ncbi:ZPR1 zinc finger domain-containing protein [Candidatus Woesearchaeota archaeon]|nr:ZPR1 zinc finger domain-containing protein [Candidatus Woesearchaeota archaeon]